MKLKDFTKKLNSGGLNAKEIEDIKKVDYKKIVKDYNDSYTKKHTINNTILIIFLIISIAGGIFINNLIFLIIIYCVFALAERSGHTKGYIVGYEDSLNNTINEILNLQEEDLKAIDEISSDLSSTKE